jgi:ribosomal protein S18 acetylase RimI-like enzyme
VEDSPTAEGLGLTPRPLRGDDFPRAREVVDAWFGFPVGLVMHRLFFEQLGPSGVWLEHDGEVVGFLLGLVSEADPELAYVHFHAVDPAWRRRGVGRALYEAFAARAAARGCRRIRALAAPSNAGSVRFHESLGFAGTFAPAYVGPGQDRLVFERSLPLAAP